MLPGSKGKLKMLRPAPLEIKKGPDDVPICRDRNSSDTEGLVGAVSGVTALKRKSTERFNVLTA